MKTKTLKLLMAALMLGTTLYVSANPNDDGGGGGGGFGGGFSGGGSR